MGKSFAHAVTIESELGMKKTILFTLLGLVIGIIIGGIGVVAYCGSGFEGLVKTMLMVQEKEIAEMKIDATKAYHEQPPEVAIWALENYIDNLNTLKEERTQNGTEAPYIFLTPDRSLVFSHARLGQLYKKLDNAEKSKYHFAQAMSKSKEIKLPAFETEEKLIEFIHKVDSGPEDVNKEN